MSRTPCLLMTTILLLALAVRAESLPPSPATSGNGAPAHALEVLGQWHRGPVYTSAVSNGYVYFGSGGAIRVLRIKDDTSWEEVATITTPGVVRGLHATKTHLYVADHSGALRIIDIATPETLKEIGQVTLSTAVRAVTVHGRYAYLAAGWSGLVVVDISDPQNHASYRARHPLVEGSGVDRHIRRGA